MRYFRSDTVEDYEAARSAVDLACGFPSAGQISAIASAEAAPRDSIGRPVLCLVLPQMSFALPAFLSQVDLGLLEEIPEAEYQPIWPSPESP